MKFTKRTLSALLALAVVFSTLVFISVGASVDFPIHNTYVTLSGGKTQNCKQSEPMYEASGKIGYANSQEFTVDAWFQSDASRLSELVQESEAMGECICIDLYAEFTSALKNTRIGASVNLGAGDVLPQSKNTNVANPTTDYSVDFVNGKIVTLKLWINDIVQVGTVADLDQVMITVYPAAKDKVTGSFFYSAPYIAAKDGENLSTVNITSFKTTTKPTENPFDGSITCYDSGVTFAGSHEAIKAQWGAKNEAFAHYGDYAGFEKKYIHIDGSGRQIQYINGVMNGLEQLRARAAAADKTICIDIYTNKFANGSVKDGKCQFFMNFTGGKNIGNDTDNVLVIRGGIKQTIVFDADSIPKNATKMNLTFQNYSYGDYTNITDAKFIITAPYVEGDAPLAPIKPSTTERPTKPDNIKWDGENITTYNNGVQYTGNTPWSNLTNGKIEAGQTKLSDGTIVKNYLHVDSSPRQQMQTGPVSVTGLSDLIEKAQDKGERMFIDLYAKNTNSYAYFFVSFGGVTTGAMDCQVYNNTKHTLEIDVDALSAYSASSISITIQNYSFSPYTIGGKFVVSVPYLESDMKNSVVEGSTHTTTTTTVSQSTTPAPTIHYPPELPLQIPDSTVKYTGGWGNPEAFYIKDEGKISYLNVFKAYSSQLQMYGNVSGLPALLVKAAEEGKNVCVDFYGNFLTKAGTAKIRLNIGSGIWYGAASRTDNPDKSDINGDKMLTIKPNEVTTLKINPQKMFDYLRSTSTTVKVDKSEKQFESLTYTGDITPKTFTQSDIEPKSAKMHQFDDVSKNDEIVYTIPDMKASTYAVKLNTRDLQSSGEYALYINGKLIDTIDFYANSKSYKTRDLGEFTVAKDGDVTVKLVSKGNYDGTSLMLDSIKFTDLLEEETTAAPQNSNETLAAKCTSVAVAIWGNGSWGGDWSTTGRFYMTVPYIEGAAKVGSVEGVTTTTTKPAPSTTAGKSFTSIDNIDFGYVDCRFDNADWNANGSTGSRVQSNRLYKFGISGDKAQQIGGQLNLNGGSIVKKFNDTDPNTWDYVSYARKAGATIAMDVYPNFSMSDGGSLYCHMNTSWATTKASDQEFQAEDILMKTGLMAEPYTYNEVDYDGATIADIEDKTFDKYADVKVGDEISYTFEGLNLARYNVEATTITSSNGAEFQVYVNDKKLDKVTFNSSSVKYGKVTLVSKYKVAEDENVTIKLVCTKPGEFVVDKFDFTEPAFQWPANIKDFKLTPGKSFTYYIDPYDIPTGSSKFSVYFDSYEYAPGWRAMQGAEIYITAPYLIGVNNPDQTTTSTTAGTTPSIVTTTSKTYAYPSNNGGGKTRFTVGDIRCDSMDTIKVPINISNNAGLYNAKFSIKFNANDLYYYGCENGEVFDNISINEDEASDGIIHITLNQSSENTFKNGAVAWLEFDASYEEGVYPISFAGSGYIPANFFNFDGKNVPCSFRTGYVIVDSTGLLTRPADHDAVQSYPETNKDGTTKFTIESVEDTYNADKEYSLNIAISGNEGISSAKFTVQYDTDKLQFVGSTVAKTMPPVFNLVDYNFDPIEYDKGILTYNIAPKDQRVINDSYNNGNIITMKFKVLSNATGKYDVSFGGESYNKNDYKDCLGNNVACSFKSGGIVIVDNKPTSPSVSTKPSETPSSSSTDKIEEPSIEKLVPANISVALSDKKAVTVKWSAVKNATKYQVYRATGTSNSFVMVASNVISTSYKDGTIVGGVTYKYKVVAMNSTASSESNVASITTMNYNKKPVVKSLKPSKKKIKVQIKKKEVGVVGFQVKASTSKKFSKKLTKTVLTSKLAMTFKKLSSGKKYFVKVRAYNVINGKKVYSKWSKVKTTKVK